MAVLKRISHLIKADLHAVLDYLEEPSAILRQAIRDMEDDLSDTVRRRERAQVRHQDLAGTLRHATEQLEALDAELDVCFAQQEEELARSVIRKKLRVEAAADRRRDTVKALDDELREIDERLSYRRETLVALKQRAELVAHTSLSLSADLPNDVRTSTLPESVSETDVGIAYLREREGRCAR